MAATDDLTTTADVKTALRISDTADDDRIEQAVTFATAAIKRYLGRTVLYNPSSTARTEYHDGDGETLFYTDEWPIVSITSLHVSHDRAYDAADLLTENTHFLKYSDDDDPAWIERILESDIENIVTGTAPIFPVGQRNIRLIYVPGYTTASRANLPQDLQAACITLVSTWINRWRGEGLTQISRGQSLEIYAAEELPPDVRRLLRRFRSV